MRWPWQKKKPGVDPETLAFIEDPFAGSPFNADVIRPGDPGWQFFEEALNTGKPVFGGYDIDGNVWIDREGSDDDPARG